MKNEKSGESVKIFVVKSDESLTEEEFLKHCRDQLAAYKVPGEVQFIKPEEMHKSNVGKILRRKFR